MSSKPINWAKWSVIGTAGWFLYEYLKGKDAAATAAQQSSISVNTPSFNANATLPNTTGDLSDLANNQAYKTPGIANSTTPSTVGMPNIQGMTSTAITALAGQMDALGMTDQANQLRAYAANMIANGVSNAPPQNI
jgi:hypothetical protein